MVEISNQMELTHTQKIQWYMGQFMGTDLALFVGEKLANYDTQTKAIDKVEIRKDGAFVIHYADNWDDIRTFIINLSA